MNTEKPQQDVGAFLFSPPKNAILSALQFGACQYLLTAYDANMTIFYTLKFLLLKHKTRCLSIKRKNANSRMLQVLKNAF